MAYNLNSGAVRRLLTCASAAVPIGVMATPPTITQGASNAASTIRTDIAGFGTTPSYSSVGAGASPLVTAVSQGPLAVNAGKFITELNAPQPYGCGMQFWMDGEAFDLLTQDYATGKFRIKVTVAGQTPQWATTGDYVIGGTGTGANYVYFKVDFGSGNAAQRLIEIYHWQPPYNILGVNVGSSAAGSTAATAKYKIWPAPLNEPSVMFFGDSITFGSVCQTSRGSYVYKAGELMGLKGVIANGAGGSGFTAGSNGSHLTFLQRAQTDMTYFGPLDLIVVAGGVNDATATAAAVTTAVTTFLRYVRSVQPNALIAQIGPWRGNAQLGGTVAPAATYSAIAAGFAAAADRGMTYIDTLASPLPWQDVTTAGNCGLYINTVDNLHPTDAGHAYLGARVAASLIGWLRSIDT